MSGKLTLKGSIWHFMDPETIKAHGPWVRHSDYAQLELALAEARAERDRLIEKGFDLITERDAARAEKVRLTSIIEDAVEDKGRWQGRATTAPEAERDRLAAEVEGLPLLLAVPELVRRRRATLQTGEKGE